MGFVDRLSDLLRRFSVRAQMFHSGPLCGITDFVAHDYAGQLHMLKHGVLEVQHAGAAPIHVTGPCAIFYPRPMAHRFQSPSDGSTELVCANVLLGAGSDNPLVQALPTFMTLPLAELADASAILAVLFAEAAAPDRCGRAHMVDRLFEVVLVYLLRSLMQQGRVDSGLLAGMADAKLAKALVAMHAQPELHWQLPTLAAQAGMSRTQFALRFREVVGATPADYLSRFRMHLVQDLLRRGRALESIAAAVGYSGAPALSRAFYGVTGKNPRQWLQDCAHVNVSEFG
jgi:AraC-like DNA-binding protein